MMSSGTLQLAVNANFISCRETRVKSVCALLPIDFSFFVFLFPSLSTLKKCRVAKEYVD